MSARPILLACLIWLAAPPSPGEAHEFWLAPSAYVAGPGRAVEIPALAGTGFRGELKPWSPAHCGRFIAKTARPVDRTPAARGARESVARAAWGRWRDHGCAHARFDRSRLDWAHRCSGRGFGATRAPRRVAPERRSHGALPRAKRSGLGEHLV